MIKEDLNRFKGEIKTALQQWGNMQIEAIIPNQPTMRFVAKNWLNNFLNRHDAKMNKWIDNVFMAVANEEGKIDSDVLVDTAVGIFKEVQPFEYVLGGGFSIEVGNGEIAVNLPRNMIMDALVGDFGRIRFTSEDLTEFKNLLK